MITTGYKIIFFVNQKYWSPFSSHFSSEYGAIIQYYKNKWVYPIIPKSKLFFYKKEQDAFKQVNSIMVDRKYLQVWQADVLNQSFLKFSTNCEFKSFWNHFEKFKRIKNYERVFFVNSHTADAIRLKRRIK